jgi:hypothetical protein
MSFDKFGYSKPSGSSGSKKPSVPLEADRPVKLPSIAELDLSVLSSAFRSDTVHMLTLNADMSNQPMRQGNIYPDFARTSTPFQARPPPSGYQSGAMYPDGRTPNFGTPSAPFQPSAPFGSAAANLRSPFSPSATFAGAPGFAPAGAPGSALRCSVCNTACASE